MIDVRDVSLTIGKHEILKDITLHVGKGTIVGLIGRNGSGKTMLMKCICGYIRPTKGAIWVDGKCIGTDIDFPEHTGVIIETPGFLPYMTGQKNLSILYELNHKKDRGKICEVMQLVGLEPDLKLTVRKYSLGMRQRLGLAQAMMEDPALLVLDEPMNGLDKEGVEDMRAYLLELKKQGKTIVLSSHSAEDIRVLCDETYELEHGSIYRNQGEW